MTYALVDGIEITVAGEGANGTIGIKFYEVAAPLHVSRIVKLARSGEYDGVAFHRVMDGFMAQTGDVQYGVIDQDLSRAGKGGSSYPDLPLETYSPWTFVRGAVGAARSSEPDTANSQFFMMFEDSSWLNPTLNNAGYTVFGHIESSDVGSLDVLDAIKRGESGSGAVAENPDYMESVTLTTALENDLFKIDSSTGALTLKYIPNFSTFDATELLVAVEGGAETQYQTISYDDGITITDAVSLLKHIVGLESLSGQNLVAADANIDGAVDISDAVEILKHIVGLESIYEHGVIDGDGETVLVAQYYGIGEDVSLFHFGDVDLTATFELV